MKKLLYFTSLMLGLALTACQEEPVSGTTVLSSEKTVAVAQGQSLQLQTTTPADFAGNSLVWFSLDEETATVQNGVVTGVKPGYTTVIATKDAKTVASYQVTVYNKKQYMAIDGVLYPILFMARYSGMGDYLYFIAEENLTAEDLNYSWDGWKMVDIDLYGTAATTLDEEFDLSTGSLGDNLRMYTYFDQMSTYGYGDDFESGTFLLSQNDANNCSIRIKGTYYDRNNGDTHTIDLYYDGKPDYNEVY